MRRTLLVTNDFPPRVGGIQSYLYELAVRLPADDLVVYAPNWPGAAEFDARQPFRIVRHPSSLMLPVPAVAATARRLLAEHRLDAVWFGASTPLGLLASNLRRSGAGRLVACSHGHEVGWSMIPGARQALRRIGHTVDVVTFISRYSRRRIASAFGPQAALEHLPPGVDAELFRPDPAARAEIRRQCGIGDAPVISCISRLVRRKGQDMLIRALPAIRAAVPGTVLMIVGGGPDADRLHRLAADVGVAHAVLATGRVEVADLPAYYASGDVFAMPCRTLGNGLDVEGLGIVFLEAGAAGLAVVAGDSGGAPEAVLNGRTGTVVDGRDLAAITAAVTDLLADPARRAKFGAAGRDWVRGTWTWDRSAARLDRILDG